MKIFARIWDEALKAAPLRLWAMMLAGPPLTLSAIGLTFIVWKGGWPLELASEQLRILGWALMANWLLIGVIIVTLAAVRLSGRGPGGVSFEVNAREGEDHSQDDGGAGRYVSNPISPPRRYEGDRM